MSLSFLCSQQRCYADRRLLSVFSASVQFLLSISISLQVWEIFFAGHFSIDLGFKEEVLMGQRVVLARDWSCSVKTFTYFVICLFGLAYTIS